MQDVIIIIIFVKSHRVRYVATKTEGKDEYRTKKKEEERQQQQHSSFLLHVHGILKIVLKSYPRPCIIHGDP